MSHASLGPLRSPWKLTKDLHCVPFWSLFPLDKIFTNGAPELLLDPVVPFWLLFPLHKNNRGPNDFQMYRFYHYGSWIQITYWWVSSPQLWLWSNSVVWIFQGCLLIRCMQQAGRGLICNQENERKHSSLSLGEGLSNRALWVGGQFKTGCQSILGARDFPSVLTFKSYSVLPPLVGKQCPEK